MNEFFFWKPWSRTEQRMVITSLICLVLALIFLSIKIIDPVANAIRWDVLATLSDLSVVVDSLRFGDWQFGISVPGHLVSEQFVSSAMEVDLFATRLFLLFSLAGVSLVLAGATSLPRFWYLVSMIVFILLIASSRTEMLGIFGPDSRLFLLLTIASYGGLSYYYHAFHTSVLLPYRWLSFSGVSILLTVVAGFTSAAAYPDLTLAVYSFPLWLLLTMVFILISATEIMALFVGLSTGRQMRKSKNSYINFLVISLLYIANLIVLYLKNTNQLQWEGTLINALVLGLLTAILGIVGFQARCASTNQAISFRESGFALYIGLFIVATSFIAFVATQGNDPLLEVMEDMVVNSQLAMSLVFLFYITANFYPVFRQGLPVYKVLYKPLKFGLTQTRVLGFAGVVILLSMEGLLPVYQAVAGYYNGLGDLYTTRKEYALAEQYFKMALQQEFQNHKSNFALASLAQRQGDATMAAYYYKQATLKQPSPQAYIGLSSVLMSESMFFDAIHSLQEGIQKFPQSAELLNNLGVLYAQTNVADSAYYYLQAAVNMTRHSEVPATNLLAVLAKNTNTTLLDSLTNASTEQHYISWQANWMTVRNLRHIFTPASFQKDAVRPDSLLNVAGLAYLVNYSLNQAKNDSLPARLLPLLADKNPFLTDELLLGALYAQFYSGDKLRALQAMTTLADESAKNQALYKKILGHWFLQLGLFEKAGEQFSMVKGTEGALGLIIANLLAGNQEIASVLMDKLEKETPEGSMQSFRKALSGDLRLPSPSDSLLAAARKAKTGEAYLKAVKANPVSPQHVAEASVFFQQKKNLKTAYQLVVDALRFNDQSGLLWARYALLSLEQGLLTQAGEGKEKASEFLSPADYQSFLGHYQPLRALIEKQRTEFQ